MERHKSYLGSAVIGMLGSFAVMPAHAAWVEVAGTIQGITTYAHTNTVLVALSASGSAGTCADASIFALDGALPEERRKQLLVMLVSGQARGAVVTLTYDNAGGCVTWDATPNVFRGIVRLSLAG